MKAFLKIAFLLLLQFMHYDNDNRLSYSSIEVKHSGDRERAEQALFADRERAKQALCAPLDDEAAREACRRGFEKGQEFGFEKGQEFERRWLIENSTLIQSAIQNQESGGEYGVKP
jgi:flagellar biosynthesis/type III secretory pathway protein FliH